MQYVDGVDDVAHRDVKYCKSSTKLNQIFSRKAVYLMAKI